eukprot:Seg4394.1 transcript_id=Seg4394.1/GoldUCD/mRNA.D3Y31 product="hypothetical protein" pseudo=true protein_id=Seg4394.1/GoldUCD/D3Y31
MALVPKEDVALGLKVISTVATGVYTGAAWFVLYGSVPSATSLKPSCCLKVTKSVFSRIGMPMGITSVVSFLSASGAYLISRSCGKDEREWLAVACILGAVHPYTFRFLMPINVRILKDELREEDIHSTMDDWWNYHFLRTLAFTGCFLFTSYKLAAK